MPLEQDRERARGAVGGEGERVDRERSSAATVTATYELSPVAEIAAVAGVAE
jgi:hypothetical protein